MPSAGISEKRSIVSIVSGVANEELMKRRKQMKTHRCSGALKKLHLSAELIFDNGIISNSRIMAYPQPCADLF